MLACALALSLPARAATTTVTVPTGALAGLTDQGAAPPATLLRLAIELQPPGDLDALAARIADPASPDHRATLDAATFDRRFGRVADGHALGELLTKSGIANVCVARNGFVVGAIVQVGEAERLFGAHWDRFGDGKRSAIAPTGPLTVPAADVRDVRGAVAATTPRLDDVRGGVHRLPRRLVPAGALSRDGGCRRRRRHGETDRAGGGCLRRGRFGRRPHVRDRRGRTAGRRAARVSEERFRVKAPSDCGRDDRGQETAIDVDAAMTMAPRAALVDSYDDVCSSGDDGTGALARALEQAPSAIVLPFIVGPVPATASPRRTARPRCRFSKRWCAAFRSSSPPVMTAPTATASRGRKAGGRVSVRSALRHLCRGNAVGRARHDRRRSAVERRRQRDRRRDLGRSATVVAKCSGGVRVLAAVRQESHGPRRLGRRGRTLARYWHGYGFGGVAGTSESAALVAAQIVAIDAAVAPEKRIVSAGDLYAFARVHPEAFRDVSRENDRGYTDNTLRPQRLPLPLDYRGMLPSPPPAVKGCAGSSPTAAR